MALTGVMYLVIFDVLGAPFMTGSLFHLPVLLKACSMVDTAAPRFELVNHAVTKIKSIIAVRLTFEFIFTDSGYASVLEFGNGVTVCL